MNILLTGGTGYIGSHVALALIEAGHTPILYDNLYNSQSHVITQLKEISGHQCSFVKDDILNTKQLIYSLEHYKIDAVLHFAGLKSVAESVREPYKYYTNNFEGTLSLLRAMEQAYGPKTDKRLVFSSSATVYGNPRYLPMDEEHPTCPINAYGRSKLAIENMLIDVASSNATWRIACLRYFNPVGSHPSGLIGDTSRGIPNNLLPNILQVANGDRPFLKVFGNNYNTIDGSGVRDYIHVTDLASGHLAAIDYLCQSNSPAIDTFNLGTGRGHSVMELISCFEMITGVKLPYIIESRRPGDIDSCYANVDKANQILHWHATHTLDMAIKSAWKWQQQVTHQHSEALIV